MYYIYMYVILLWKQFPNRPHIYKVVYQEPNHYNHLELLNDPFRYIVVLLVDN